MKLSFFITYASHVFLIPLKIKKNINGIEVELAICCMLSKRSITEPLSPLQDTV